MFPLRNESGAVINAEGHPAELQLRIQVSTRFPALRLGPETGFYAIVRIDFAILASM